MTENNLLLIHYKSLDAKNKNRIFSSSVRQLFVDNYPHPLFHNHYPDGKSIIRSKGAPFQFKVINNEVFILAINEGVEFAESFQWPNEIKMPLGKQRAIVELKFFSKATIKASFKPIEFQCYRNISPYLALHQERFELFSSLSENEKRKFIENGIANHILTAAKWCGIRVNKDEHMIKVNLLQMKIGRPLRIKDHIYYTPFDVMFECNTEIPDYIGIGKFVSRGYGTVVQYG